MSKYYSLAIYIRNRKTPTSADLYHQYDLPNTILAPMESAAAKDLLVVNLNAVAQGLAQNNRPATDLFFILYSMPTSGGTWSQVGPIQGTDSAAIQSLT